MSGLVLRPRLNGGKAPLRRGFFLFSGRAFLAPQRASGLVAPSRCQLIPNGFQIPPRDGNILLKLIKSMFQNEPVAAPALQLVANPARLMFEFCQRFRQGTLLAPEFFNRALIDHAGLKGVD